MTAPTLRPDNKPAIGPHAIHQDIAEVVAALDTLRTQVNVLRLSWGDTAMTRKRLNEGRECLVAACAFINEATNCVTVARIQDKDRAH